MFCTLSHKFTLINQFSHVMNADLWTPFQGSILGMSEMY